MGVLAPGSVRAWPSAHINIDTRKLEIRNFRHTRGQGGPPPILFHPQFFVCDIKPQAKFAEHLLGEKLPAEREKKEKDRH
jgi:hypothetical protein